MGVKATEITGGGIERQVLTGMIVSRRVLSAIAAKWTDEGLFPDRMGNVIGGLCVDYWNRYGKAPRKAMEGLVANWASDHKRDKTTLDMVTEFMSALSKEYESSVEAFNASFVLDQATRFFDRTAASQLALEVQGAVDAGQLDKALAKIESFRKVEIATKDFVQVLQDKEIRREALADSEKPLLRLKGALGEFFDEALARDNFISLMAPMKRGKTFILLELAWQCMRSRLHTMFFEVGDMTQNQIMRRFIARAAKRPISAKTIRYPTSISAQTGKVTVGYEERRFDTRMTEKECDEAFVLAMRKGPKSLVDSYLDLKCTDAGSYAVRQIKADVEQLSKKRGWSPDVIVIDYAELLKAPSGSGTNNWEKQNAVWTELRALSTSLHCLVITATQANAASFKAETMNMTHFAGTNMKYAHTTGIVAINQNVDEKQKGVVRLNWLTGREYDYDPAKSVYLAGCLSIANPAVLSCWKSPDPVDEDSELSEEDPKPKRRPRDD